MLKAITLGNVSAYAVPGLTYSALYSSAGSVTAAGVGNYVPGDAVTLTGGTFTTAAVVSVTHTKVVSATVAVAGTGGTPGTQTLTGTSGTGTKFQASCTVSAGGIVTAVLSITVAGDYTVNPTALATEPVTGASLTGAQLNVVMGALSFTVKTPGVYSTIPGTPAVMAQGSSTGTGTGATFSISFGPIASDVNYNVTTVAALPAAATSNKGARAFVTDANATTFASTVASGGANNVPVFSDGTNWKIG